MIQLLHGLHRNIDSVPPAIGTKFLSVLDDLLRTSTTAPEVAPTPSALAIALGPLYPVSPIASSYEIDSLAQAPSRALPPSRSSADSRHSTTGTVLQSFDGAVPAETVFMARPSSGSAGAFSKPAYKTDTSSKDNTCKDQRPDSRPPS